MGMRARWLSSLVLVAGCKTAVQPTPEPSAPPPRIGWNTSVQEHPPEPPESRTPDPDPDHFRRACERVLELSGEPLEGSDMIEECVEDARSEWRDDPARFDAQAQCFFESETMAEAETCASSVPRTPRPTDDIARACERLARIAATDPSVSAEMRDALRDPDACAERMQQQSEADFRAFAECVAGSGTIEELSRCERARAAE